jgi:hypothetical protein
VKYPVKRVPKSNGGGSDQSGMPSICNFLVLCFFCFWCCYPSDGWGKGKHAWEQAGRFASFPNMLFSLPQVYLTLQMSSRLKCISRH